MFVLSYKPIKYCEKRFLLLIKVKFNKNFTKIKAGHTKVQEWHCIISYDKALCYCTGIKCVALHIEESILNLFYAHDAEPGTLSGASGALQMCSTHLYCSSNWIRR